MLVIYLGTKRLISSIVLVEIFMIIESGKTKDLHYVIGGQAAWNKIFLTSYEPKES